MKFYSLNVLLKSTLKADEKEQMLHFLKQPKEHDLSNLVLISEEHLYPYYFNLTTFRFFRITRKLFIYVYFTAIYPQKRSAKIGFNYDKILGRFQTYDFSYSNRKVFVRKLMN